ncbi:MAG: outer membrane lipoprotein-sorting protein [Rhodospirillales bacterium]|nr:outer membrane lipoprotein-sorting protein [Rhodospirillales bacterium]
MKSTITRVALSLFLGFVVTIHSVNAQAASAEEMMERSQRAFHYAGNDAKGKMTMELIDRRGGKRVRVLTMLRRNQGGKGDQKYFMYFHEPGDVRRLTFMVWKFPAREDDRWIFIPAVDLIRRIAAEDKYSSFVGSDFSYEDVSGRDVAEDTHTLVREEKLDGRDTFVIQSIPHKPAAFTKRISWIDKQNFLPLKEEYYDAQNELQRVFTADRIEKIAYPTIMKRTMKNVKTGHRTEVTVNAVTYDLGLEDADFSERRMRRPPRSWIR